MAYRCGISVFSVHRAETGKTCGMETIKVICKVLRLKLADIVIKEKPKQRKSA